MKTMLITIALILVSMAPLPSRAANEDSRSMRVSTQLMVLFVPRNMAEILRPSEVMSAIRSKNKTDRQIAISARFGFPTRITRLLGEHASESDIVLPLGGKLRTEEILQQYLLLEFETPDMAMNASTRLKLDKGVLLVEHPALMQPSSSMPTDPGAVQGNYTSPFDYQWALGSLNLYAAWDKARGHAYVGHVDTGVYTGQTLNPDRDPNYPTVRWYPKPLTIHPDLSQSFRSHRTWSAINSQNMPTVGNVIVVDDYFMDPSTGHHTILDAPLAENAPPGAVPAYTADIYRGHGTHTAGIIVANTSFSGNRPGFQNPNSLGVSGVCWNCSLHVAKTNRADLPGPTDFEVAAGIGWAISTGVQVINLSSGSPSSSPAGVYGENFCNDTSYHVICASLALAAAREVVFVAAAGNGTGATNGLDFPSSDNRTIAVGAIDSTGARIYNGQMYSQSGPGMLTWGLVAPGKDVLSTVYPNFVYNPDLPCGDGYGRFAGQGFGPCTGTSMAAPFVTGIVALMRSANPLLTATEIRSRLLATSDRASNRDIYFGAGKPNASAAIDAVLADTNRLTPLFSMQTAYPTTENPRNYLYSTVPQVGAAAYNGNFLPVEIGAGSYAAYGNPVAIFPGFPGGGPARAQTWIFTTHVNPINPAYDLKPIYRMSRRCYVGAPSCNSYSIDVDHYYASDYAEVQSMIAREWGHSLDGIEGYVYPEGQIPNMPQGTSYPQPANTVKLVSGTAWIPNSPGYKHAVYPEGQAPDGYIYLLKTLGYVYLNPSNGVKPTY